MSKTRFISRFKRYRTYVGSTLVSFENGEYVTSDDAIAAALKAKADYGLTLTSVTEKPAAPAPTVAPTEPAVQEAPAVDSSPEAQPTDPAVAKYACKKCAFSTNDLKEYRKHCVSAHRK